MIFIMSWDQIYADMAFSPYKESFTEYHNIKDALVTLYCYMQGQAKAYEVHDALGFLEQSFGSGVLMGCNLIRKSLREEDDEITRDQTCYEGISLIERYIRRYHNAQQCR